MNLRRRHLLLATAAGTLIAGVVFAADRRPDSHDNEAGHEQSRVQIGYRIAPVHLNLENRNRSLVGLGSYLVNSAGGCNDCHTCPTYRPGVEHNPYIGGDGQVNGDAHLAGGVPFALGPQFTLYSANLTPDATGLPGGMTWEQFKTAIRTGADPHEDRTLLVMPWPFFRYLSDHDLRAIYEYLGAIPPAETPAPGTCQNAGEGTFPSGAAN